MRAVARPALYEEASRIDGVQSTRWRLQAAYQPDSWFSCRPTAKSLVTTVISSWSCSTNQWRSKQALAPGIPQGPPFYMVAPEFVATDQSYGGGSSVDPNDTSDSAILTEIPRPSRKWRANSYVASDMDCCSALASICCGAKPTTGCRS